MIIKNGRSRPSVFEALLSTEKMAKLNESLYKFTPAFYLQDRSIRVFPYNAAANILGYTAEVDTNFLKKHPNEGCPIKLNSKNCPIYAERSVYVLNGGTLPSQEYSL